MVVIGAGPYGLPVAARLKAQGMRTLVFGKPLEFWKNMPSGLYLKSIWSASSLSDPANKYSLSKYAPAHSIARKEPIPLALFLTYACWLQQQALQDVDPTYVRWLARDGTTREVDYVFLGTGYRPDLQKLPFIDSALRQQVQVQHGYPVLNTWFESFVPHLHCIGALAGHTFGPTCRFVSGAMVPAKQVARHAAKAI